MQDDRVPPLNEEHLLKSTGLFTMLSTTFKDRLYQHERLRVVESAGNKLWEQPVEQVKWRIPKKGPALFHMRRYKPPVRVKRPDGSVLAGSELIIEQLYEGVISPFVMFLTPKLKQFRREESFPKEWFRFREKNLVKAWAFNLPGRKCLVLDTQFPSFYGHRVQALPATDAPPGVYIVGLRFEPNKEPVIEEFMDCLYLDQDLTLQSFAQRWSRLLETGLVVSEIYKGKGPYVCIDPALPYTNPGGLYIVSKAVWQKVLLRWNNRRHRNFPSTNPPHVGLIMADGTARSLTKINFAPTHVAEVKVGKKRPTKILGWGQVLTTKRFVRYNDITEVNFYRFRRRLM